MPNISQKHPVSVFRGHLWTANEICETVCQLVNQHVLLGNPCVWDIPAICETHVKNWCLQVLRQNLFHIVSHMPYINHIFYILCPYEIPVGFMTVLWWKSPGWSDRSVSKGRIHQLKVRQGPGAANDETMWNARKLFSLQGTSAAKTPNATYKWW